MVMQDISLGSAVLLGVVEGLTEFVPVSSTGHMILVSDLLGIHGDKIETFEIFIQLGAILAVVLLYLRRFRSLFDFSGSCSAVRQAKSFAGWCGLIKLMLACAPMFIAGGLLGSTVKRHLFSSGPVALALVLGGILILLFDTPKKDPIGKLEDLDYRRCLLIGIFQCAALWPGMSRSASTIIGGLLCGVERRVAAEFSFLVAVPVMGAATLADLAKNASLLSAADIPAFSLGFAVAFITALLAVRFFVNLLGVWTLRPFGFYRIVLGGLVFALLTYGK